MYCTIKTNKSTYKNHFKLLVFILLLVLRVNQMNAQDATKAHKDALNNVVIAYYDLNIKIFQANSTVEDIDNTFKLFTDDFTYVHP